MYNLNPNLPINGKNKDNVEDKDYKALLSGQRLNICPDHLH